MTRDAAPMVDVVHIDELDGPLGGRLLVLRLSCGDWMTMRSRRTPPARTRCTACWTRSRTPRRRAVVAVEGGGPLRHLSLPSEFRTPVLCGSVDNGKPLALEVADVDTVDCPSCLSLIAWIARSIF